MELGFLFIAIAAIFLLIVDVRSRLPKSRQDPEMTYHPPNDGGYQLLVKHIIPRDFEVGFCGNWRLGRSFDLVGEIIPFHPEYVPDLLLEFKKTQTIHFIPESRQIERTRLGWPSRVAKDRSFDSANVFLPVELHTQLFEQLKEDENWVVELHIGEDRRAKQDAEPTFGIYRVTVRKAEARELSLLGEG
ncbi:hypothetical protein [Erythrobacter sp. KY5]|uniref:hypothetical protein n=1 Tax=Erythrobacter sp. KY5 TaxID=2011159 RepID=UPI0013A69EDA|nr:hypothetical protein [Erythrobacter sp. KY5]